MIRLSEKPTVHEPVQMKNVGLGIYTEIGSYSYLENTHMGDFSYCGPNGFFQNTRILKFSNIAAAVRIGPTAHPMDRPTLHHFTYRRKMYGFDSVDDAAFLERRESQITEIGHDTWIGHGAIIMPGLRMGHGAILGSGAVLTKDLPDYHIAVGVPAKILRPRFPEKTISFFLKLQWWNWPAETIQERLSDFCGSIDAFMEKYGD